MVALIRHDYEQAETARSGAQVLELDARHPRRDALPENTYYADNGCDLHPSCLSCPLVRCRYDEPGGIRQVLNKDRDQEVLSLQRQRGMTVEKIARQVGISRRTVFRILARERSSRVSS